ncbi:MAG: four helix bundle protein, partial [Candidatus Latescibacteria bacterium]|nr:four helix bundle protein [Candidatus Latescibacterota bacterium]NIO77893.1 four helix bundle protein [Candidatus Latescibacterota bacterium]
KLVLSIYKYTENFPGHEIYGLASQLRRAAVSAPANIAEGFRRHGKQDKKRFLNVSQGSLKECRYYLILAQDLSYGNSLGLIRGLEEISKLLDAYMRSIRDHS